jgi:hypothetical protein
VANGAQVCGGQSPCALGFQSDGLHGAVTPSRLRARTWRRWLGSYDQYRAGRGGDVSHWLSCYNAKPVLIDRKTSTRKTIFIERSAVSITGGIQPRILARMLGEQHFENGLAARFGFGMPPKRAKIWSNASISESASQELEFIYDALLALDFGSGWDGKQVPIDLPLTSEAGGRYFQGGSSPRIASFASNSSRSRFRLSPFSSRDSHPLSSATRVASIVRPLRRWLKMSLSKRVKYIA